MSIDESPPDNSTAYALGDLGFVYNHTAFTDICMYPSLRDNYGFFAAPNAFNIVQDLVPIFSQSKISSFQDILYPSPWYWLEKTKYDEKRDPDWDKKQEKLYWRGSTTGGYSRHGGWRRQHRQRFVREINALGEAKVLANVDGQWQTETKSRPEYKDMFDVTFSGIGQCEPADCQAQTEFFNVVEKVDQQDAWGFKHLLDIDGNAFSGRFYAFLKSKSMVYKMALFQEWHMEWLKPWVHYVPLSLKGDEWLEAVRWYSREEEGREQGRVMAERSREFAGKALRKEDMEIWFFRLLLE